MEIKLDDMFTLKVNKDFKEKIDGNDLVGIMKVVEKFQRIINDCNMIEENEISLTSIPQTIGESIKKSKNKKRNTSGRTPLLNESDEQKLIDIYENGDLSFNQIAKKYFRGFKGHQLNAIYYRLKKRTQTKKKVNKNNVTVATRNNKPFKTMSWSDNDRELLRKCMKKGMKYNEIRDKHFPNRTVKSIMQQYYTRVRKKK